MKKLSILALLLCMALPLTSCSSREIGEYYEHAQLYLGCKDYAYAAELFEQLGEYEDSAEYALYARAMQAIQEEDYALARANFETVDYVEEFAYASTKKLFDEGYIKATKEKKVDFDF